MTDSPSANKVASFNAASVWMLEQVRKFSQLQPFYSCILACQGPTCIFWANLTPFSLQLAGLLMERNQPGDAAKAAGFAAEAAKLARGVLSLYNAGEGFFSALYPNGAPDRASPNVMGPASFRLEIGVFCDFYIALSCWT